MTAGWGGSRTRAARAYFRPMIQAGNVDCPRCGLPVTEDTPWDVGHQVDQALGGGHELAGLWPEHARCNRSAGGKLGHQLAGKRGRGTMPPRPVKRRAWS